ncbi:MAG: alpha/beta fold hydrolase [Bacteroidetes bacterium]|nr:alpha/beta fold hydrolase [Bacteroidota bacterium]
MIVMESNTSKNSDWFDSTEYPFESKYLQIGPHRMHYVDEGSGPTILFVHGTPTWSFLYRKQIQALSKHFRCVAMDHIGFGLSDKPEQADYSPEWHSQNLEKLVEALQLKEITLVVHDFGGPIGLSFAIRRPERISKVVLLNTFLWETASNPAARKVDKIVRSALGRFLYLRMNASPKLLLRSAFTDKRKLTKAIHRHYTDVFPNKSSRFGLLKMAENLVGSSDWYDRQWQQLDRIASKPFLIVWGMKDSFIGPDYLKIWEDKLSNVKDVIRLPEAGHFVQEEAAGELTHAVEQFCFGDTQPH